MIRIVAGTYEGLLYGWEMPTTGGNGPAKMKLTFGYSAHSECIKSVALMAAKQGKTLLSGSADEMIKCVCSLWHYCWCWSVQCTYNAMGGAGSTT
jgi:protein MAK11